MTFYKTQEDLVNLLSVEYPDLDFKEDFALANKLDELAFLIIHRQRNPFVKKEKVKDNEEYKKPFGW